MRPHGPSVFTTTLSKAGRKFCAIRRRSKSSIPEARTHDCRAVAARMCDGSDRAASATPGGGRGRTTRTLWWPMGQAARLPVAPLRGRGKVCILSCKIELNLSLRVIGTGGDTWWRSVRSGCEVLFAKKARTDASVAASHLTGRPRNAANRRGLGALLHHHHRLVGHDPGLGVA